MSTVDVEILLERRGRGRADPGNQTESLPRIPRIARLMALAIKFQEMLDRKEVRDYADLARLGYVTRARLTQIMNLLLLAPDIQERLLSAGSSNSGNPAPTERQLRAVTSVPHWSIQRGLLSRIGSAKI